MSFLNFINQFYGKKESQLNSLSSMLNDDIRAKYQKNNGVTNPVSMFLKNFDINKDGKLDNSEIDKLKKVSAFIKSDNFDNKKIDKNKDGIFSADEIERFVKNQPAQTNEINKLKNAAGEVIAKQFKETKNKDSKLSVFMNAFDRNNDGKLDEQESEDMRLVSKYLQRDDDFDMEQLDTNKDGKITKDEMFLFRLAKRFDSDNDGKMNEEESVNLKLAIQFDENKDGVLSEDETNRMMMAKTADKDKNGELSQSERAEFENLQNLQQQAKQELAMTSLNLGYANNNGSLPVGNNAYVQGNYRSDLDKIKSEPTISQKMEIGELEIKQLETKIQEIKDNAQKEIEIKEQNVKKMEETLLEAKESDSEDIKNLKEGISEKSSEIIKKETELRAKENEIFNLKSIISRDKIVLAGMQKEYAGLRTDTNSSKINAINAARKAQLEKEIEQLKATIAENEKKLEETTKQRDELKNKIIPQLKEERSELEDALSKTDESYKENVEALKEVRAEFESAKSKIEKDCDKKIEELEKSLSVKKKAQLELSEQQGTIKGKAGQVGAVIDSMMAQDGVLAGKGDLIAQIAEEYGIPVDVFASIIAVETGRGTSNAIKYKNNPGGLMNPSTNWQTLQVFNSLEDGLRKMASNLQKNYINQGRTTLETIQPKYCPVGASNDKNGTNRYWLANTTRFSDEIKQRMS